ncbi:MULTISPECIES: hypothetical protein [Persicobacter]|uniref:hypothetical protein n=1 Tax=Persicobacter TaxID=59740 RepID=UPI0006A9DD96|nr:hypothetical protein [Persicobacter sp. CCB-QB2]
MKKPVFILFALGILFLFSQCRWSSHVSLKPTDFRISGKMYIPIIEQYVMVEWGQEGRQIMLEDA